MRRATEGEISQDQLLNQMTDFMADRQLNFIKLQKERDIESAKLKQKRKRLTISEGDNQGVKVNLSPNSKDAHKDVSNPESPQGHGGRSKEEEERLSAFLIYASALEKISHQFDVIRAKKATMVHPAKVPTLPKQLNKDLDLTDLAGLSQTSGGITAGGTKSQHEVLSTLAELSKLQKQPKLTRTNLTKLKI